MSKKSQQVADFFLTYTFLSASHLWPTHGQSHAAVLTRHRRRAGGREIVVSCQNLRSEETETTLDNNKHPPSHCHHEAKREAETQIALLLQYDFISSIFRRYYGGCHLSVKASLNNYAMSVLLHGRIMFCNAMQIEQIIAFSEALTLAHASSGMEGMRKEIYYLRNIFRRCGHLAGYRKF